MGAVWANSLWCIKEWSMTVVCLLVFNSVSSLKNPLDCCTIEWRQTDARTNRAPFHLSSSPIPSTSAFSALSSPIPCSNSPWLLSILSCIQDCRRPSPLFRWCFVGVSGSVLKLQNLSKACSGVWYPHFAVCFHPLFRCMYDRFIIKINAMPDSLGEGSQILGAVSQRVMPRQTDRQRLTEELLLLFTQQLCAEGQAALDSLLLEAWPKIWVRWWSRGLRSENCTVAPFYGSLLQSTTTRTSRSAAVPARRKICKTHAWNKVQNTRFWKTPLEPFRKTQCFPVRKTKAQNIHETSSKHGVWYPLIFSQYLYISNELRIKCNATLKKHINWTEPV